MFKMKGVVPPMVTPFTKSGEVDYDGIKKLVGFLKNEVNGLFITGSYGGAPLLSEQEHKDVFEAVQKEVNDLIPVVAHVGTADSKSAARLAKHAMENGAAAVSAVGPYYYVHNDDSICEFYNSILESVEGKVPVYVYNNPQFQGYPMSLSLIKRLKSLGVSGLKDATFDIIAHANYIRTLKDENFDLALGTEAMWLSSAVLGCEAFIPGIGNVFPEICAKMYIQAMQGDFEACRKTQFEVNELRDIMYLAKSTQLAVYAMLEIRGIVKTYPRSPFIPATEQEKENIKARLIQMNML